ncbi:RNA polymerase sigma factor [Lawsonibacter celer]|uniref:RNA polymerase sigma factor n=1 Tax=Lawsonibacter celer TaxID=2986526 RepID=UPI001FABA5B5|nr:RNA polymerase sigma factor [Lawsonibacter celer]
MLFAMAIEGGALVERSRQAPVDEALFPRIGQGDQAAFEALYRQTERAVYTFALSLLKNPHDALDVTQETYLKVRASAHLYQPQGKPLAWLFTIARNLSNSLLRQSGRSVSAEEYFSADGPGCAYLEDPSDRLALTAALDGLEELDRQVVLLHVVSGLKHREIAQDLGLPLGTVLTRYHRALKKLRHILSEGGALHG